MIAHVVFSKICPVPGTLNDKQIRTY